MRTCATAFGILFLAGSLTATLLGKPTSPGPRVKPGAPDDPAIHCTPTAAPGVPGSPKGVLARVASDALWSYKATYRKSARSFKVLCYDDKSRLQATIEITGLASTDAPGRLPKTARASISFGKARFTEGVFSFRGPAPRAGARYRFETSNSEPNQQNWQISGDCNLEMLP